MRRLTEAPFGVGTEHVFERRFAGRLIESRNRFTQYDQERLFVEFEIPEGWITGKASYAVRAIDDDSCRLTSRMDFRVTGLGRILSPLLTLLLRRDSARDEASLKGLLEQRSSRSRGAGDDRPSADGEVPR